MYLFMSRSEMEADIKSGRFLEHGEYDGNLYGTKIDSIHEVVDSGKICILDVNPQVTKTNSFFLKVVRKNVKRSEKSHGLKECCLNCQTS